MMKREDELSNTIIGLAIEVHRHLGTGLLESAYEECLCREFSIHKMVFAFIAPLRFNFLAKKCKRLRVIL